MEKTWYKTYKFNYLITEVTVVEETEHFVLIKGQLSKDKKRSEFSRYYETKQDAKDYLLMKLQKQRDELARAEAEFASNT